MSTNYVAKLGGGGGGGGAVSRLSLLLFLHLLFFMCCLLFSKCLAGCETGGGERRKYKIIDDNKKSLQLKVCFEFCIFLKYKYYSSSRGSPTGYSSRAGYSRVHCIVFDSHTWASRIEPGAAGEQPGALAA
jgi:hypothetical protein